MIAVMEGIVTTDDVLGGEPRVEGRRISVRQIAALVIDGGNPPADVADQLDLAIHEIHLALAYHYANPEEMAAVRETHDERMRQAREQGIEPPETLTR
jgi:uncharacterized protein (DUF433 family)